MHHFNYKGWIVTVAFMKNPETIDAICPVTFRKVKGKSLHAVKIRITKAIKS